MNKLMMTLALLSLFSCGHDTRKIDISKTNELITKNKKEEQKVAQDKAVAKLEAQKSANVEAQKVTGTLRVLPEAPAVIETRTSSVQSNTPIKIESKLQNTEKKQVSVVAQKQTQKPVVVVQQKAAQEPVQKKVEQLNQEDILAQEVEGDSVKCAVSFIKETSAGEKEVKSKKSLCLGINARGEVIDRTAIEDDKTIYNLLPTSKVQGIDLLSLEKIENDDDYSHYQIDYKILTTNNGVEELNISAVSVLDFSTPEIHLPFSGKSGIRMVLSCVEVAKCE